MADDAIGLTHSQTQIWVGQRLNPASPLYNMAFAFVFPAEIRPDLFRRAWRLVADDSDALRTRVVEGKGGGVRRVVDEVAVDTEILHLEGGPDPELRFRSWCLERCSRPFPTDGALVDSVLVQLGDGRTGWYLNQHHLVADAWSTELVFREVGEAYRDLIVGREPDREPLAAYYPAAANLEPHPDRRAAADGHWAQRQSRPGRVVSFYGRGGEPVGTPSTRLSLELDEAQSRALDRLARQEGFASPAGDLSRFAVFATLLSSWLHRVSGSAELGFDAPVAGRPTADSKRAIGLFIEMFPFAARVNPDDSFRSLGTRCLGEAMDFLRHALPGTSSPSSAASSNVVLNFFPVAFGDFAGIPASVEWVHPGHGDSVHALRLQVHDLQRAGRYTLHFDFNDGALPETLRRRSVLHFRAMLRAMVDDPDQRISAVEILVDDERRLLETLNSTDRSPLPDHTVVDMFRARVKQHPDRIAVRQGGHELTYAQLAEQTEAVAASLIRHGVEPGDRVAVLSRRSIPAVTAILASLRAGAAYVPIEARVPQARLDQLVDDSGARVVLTGDTAKGCAVPAGVLAVSVADCLKMVDGGTIDRPGPLLEDAAYLIYTSGSTGQPKGVVVEHGGLADYLEWAARRYVRGDRLTFPLFTSIGFDLTVTSLFLPLTTGGTLEVYPEPDGPADTALMDVLRANAVDFIKLTPSHLALLERFGVDGSRIRRMVVGGENLRTQLAAAVSMQLHDRVEIHNEYGPTEAVVGCVAHRFDPHEDTDPSVPIGVPADHVTVEILNQSGSPVPEGVPGELWVSGYGIARGYHGLPELTAERFREHPDRPGERRYRTGDLVRITPAGHLEYLGRLDRQLKVSGYRVEPAEIEASLQSLPMIEQCVVVARRHHSVAVGSGREMRRCVRCGLPSNYPRAVIADDGVCSVCHSYDAIKDNAQAYFKTMDDLRRIFDESARRHESEYDCMMLYSGGKDSSYALCKLVDMGLKVYAFTLDNGYIADGAKENIRRVTEQLGVPVEFATTPAMNAIFRDSLMRFSNVCNGCFKTIYTLSMTRARELGIPIIVTGLSRGQMFETRLTEDMFRDGRCSPEEVDAAVLAARRVYHRVADEVTRSLDVSIFDDDRIFDEIRFVDFYRFHDVSVDELYSYLRSKVPWVRPADTGRSTNCLINDAGIFVHQRERGFHNYALPYSWDVRLGHKTRDEALDELDDVIDPDHVEKTLADIGYRPRSGAPGSEQTALEAYFVASQDVSDAQLRERLGEMLPPQLVPVHMHRVDSIPLTASGKVDERALTTGTAGRPAETPYRAPEGPVETYLVGIWQEELGIDRLGADDDFFELGGTSLTAMQVMLQLCNEYDIDLPLETMFTHTVLADLAQAAEDRILADVADIPDDQRRLLEDAEPTA